MEFYFVGVVRFFLASQQRKQGKGDQEEKGKFFEGKATVFPEYLDFKTEYCRASCC